MNLSWPGATADEPVSRRAFLGRGALFAGAVGLGLSGCGSSTGSQVAKSLSSGPPTGGSPIKGGSLRVGFVTGGNAETISPLNAGLAGTQDYARVYGLYDPLVTPLPGGGVGPALATSWEANRDATVWTFHLRRGVVFHSGKSFGADDVLYTMQHSWASPKNSFHAGLASIIDFKGVRKLDRYTVQVPLKIAIAQFPSAIVISQCYIGQAGTTNWGDGNGTGPFTLKSFRPGVGSVFGPNANYWRSAPFLERLVIDSSYPTDGDRFNAQVTLMSFLAPIRPSRTQTRATSGS